MFDVSLADVRYLEHQRRVDRIIRQERRPASRRARPPVRTMLAQEVLVWADRLRLPIRPAGKTAALPANRG